MAKAHQIVLKVIKRKSWVGRDKIDILCREGQRKKVSRSVFVVANSVS